MQGLEKLQELAGKLTGADKANATELVRRMGEVIEGIGDRPLEWRPANLKVVQATTDRSKLPKGAGVGSVIIGEIIKEQPLKVIPIRMWDTRQKWSADRDNTKLECWSPDASIGFTLARECKTCPHSKFDPVANRSDCNKTKTVSMVSEDLTEIFTTNFSKTAYQSGVAFQDLMAKARVSPYKRVYNLSTASHPKYKNVEILGAEPDTKAALSEAKLAFLEELYNVMNADRNSSLALIRDLVKAKQLSGAAPALPSPAGHEEIPIPEGVAALAQESSAPKYDL